MQIPATSSSQDTIEILIAAFGATIACIQGFTLYVLGDIRSRVKRLEDLQMNEPKQ